MHPALKTRIVIDCHDVDLPQNVRNDIDELHNFERGQDSYIIFNEDIGHGDYPHLAKLLADNDVKECIILIWW